MKKLKYLVIPILALVLGMVLASATASRSTTAYLTDRDNAENTLSVGTNEIEIEENFDPPTPTPGVNQFKKAVRIKNTGKIDCFTRVFIEFSDNDVRNKSQVSTDGTNWYTLEEFKNHLPSGWVYESTGDMKDYFYYTSAIKPGESTPYLLDSVKTTFDSEADIEPFDIFVYAESIQTLSEDGVLFEGANGWKDAWSEFLR